MMREVDLENRDPNGINGSLSVAFEDVIAEPDGIKSCDCVWKLSFTCFTCWQSCCYKLYTFLCGICIAVYWGLQFGYIAFTHVWCITPCMRVLEINCSVLKKIYTLCIDCCIEPCCGACGKLFYAFERKN